MNLSQSRQFIPASTVGRLGWEFGLRILSHGITTGSGMCPGSVWHQLVFLARPCTALTCIGQGRQLDPTGSQTKSKLASGSPQAKDRSSDTRAARAAEDKWPRREQGGLELQQP